MLKPSIHNTAQGLKKMTTADLTMVHGKAWIDDRQRPVYGARVVSRGSDKGKIEVIIRGKGNQAKSFIIKRDDFNCDHIDQNHFSQSHNVKKCSICGGLIHEKSQ